MGLKEIGRVLRLCRERKELSQKELAYRLNIDQSEVSRIETGKSDAGMEVAVKWGRITDSSELIAMIFSDNKEYDRVKMVDDLMHHMRSAFQVYEMMAIKNPPAGTGELSVRNYSMV